MLERIRQRSGEESGFTLVELLVVMLILGILAAIAVPSFFNQRDKARDADAKSLVRTAETAMETYATDNNGSYSTPTAATPAALINIEGSLNNADGGDNSGDGDALALTLGSDADGETYTVSVTSSTGNVFSISRAGNGVTSLTCTDPGEDGCPGSGSWG